MKYSASFTAGSLLLNEFNSLIKLILTTDLRKEKDTIIKENILKINSESSRRRVLSEIIKRVEAVDNSVWRFYTDCNENEKRALLFYVILKSHPLVFDFQREIILENFRTYNLIISKADIEMFLMKKSSSHPEIDSWSPSTLSKIIHTTILILQQSNILNNYTITPLTLTNIFWVKFIKVGDPWFLELALLNKAQRKIIHELNT